MVRVERMGSRSTVVWMLEVAMGVALCLSWAADPAKHASGSSAAEPAVRSGDASLTKPSVAVREVRIANEVKRVDASATRSGSTVAAMTVVVHSEWDVLRGALTGQVFKLIQGKTRFDRRKEALEQHAIEFLVESPSLPPVVVGRCTTALDGSHAFGLSGIHTVVPSAAGLADPQLQVWVRGERLLTSSQRACLSNLFSTEKQTQGGHPGTTLTACDIPKGEA